MSTSPHIAEVTAQDFQQQVLDRSHKQPVLVDFWAGWCQPCQTLMPLLTKLAEEYQGKFLLAKIDTDVEQALARQNQVRSLPTVKLFRNGQVVDTFLGAQSEKTIRELLERHMPRASDARLAAALADWDAGKRDDALAQMQVVTEGDPANEQARIEFADKLCQHRRYSQCQAVLAGLSFNSRQGPAVIALQAKLNFAQALADDPSPEALQASVDNHPDDHASRYRLAAHHVLAGQYAAALEHLLEIVRRDRKFDDDAGRKAIVEIFNILGKKDPLVNKYRPLLAKALN